MNLCNVFFRIALILTLTGLLSSCSSDDDRQELFLKDAIFEYAYDLGIANAGGSVTTPVATVQLDELLKQYTYTPPIQTGTLNLTSGTSIRITAFKEAIELKDFTLTVNGVSKKLGDIKVENTEIYNQHNQQFVIDFFNRMIKDKNLKITATFTPSRKIVDEDGLKINFVIKGDYSYLEKK